jgi:hypothetical protein
MPGFSVVIVVLILSIESSTLLLAKQVLYYLNHSPSPSVLFC